MPQFSHGGFRKLEYLSNTCLVEGRSWGINSLVCPACLAHRLSTSPGPLGQGEHVRKVSAAVPREGPGDMHGHWQHLFHCLSNTNAHSPHSPGTETNV